MMARSGSARSLSAAALRWHAGNNSGPAARALLVFSAMLLLSIESAATRSALAVDGEIRDITATAETDLRSDPQLTSGFAPLQLRLGDSAGVVGFSLRPHEPVNSGARYIAVQPGGMREPPGSLALARWVAAKSGSSGTPLDRSSRLEAVAAENAARQAAIWNLTEAYDLGQVSGPDIRSRAQELVEAARAAPPLDTNYPTGYGIGMHVAEEHIATVRVAVDLRSAGGGIEQRSGLGGELVTVTGAGQPPVVRITKDDGGASWLLNRPAADETYTAQWATTIVPGLVLQADAEGATPVVTGGPAQFGDSARVPVAHGSLQELSQIGLDNLVQELSGNVVTFLALVVLCFVISVWFMIKFVAQNAPKVIGIIAVSALLILGAAAFINAQWPYRPTTAASFEAGRYPGQAEGLDLPKSATASSTYVQPGQCFGVWAALDGDDSTAWVSEAGRGVGQLIALDLGQPYWLRGMLLTNGLESNYYGNGRIRHLQVIGDGGYFASTRVSDAGAEESISFEAPFLLTRYIVIRVTEQTSGFDNVALGELQLFGYPADEQDAATHEKALEVSSAPGYDAVAATARPEDQCGKP